MLASFYEIPFALVSCRILGVFVATLLTFGGFYDTIALIPYNLQLIYFLNF